MTANVSQVANTSSFGAWLAITNQLAAVVTSNAVTVDSTSRGSVSTGNCVVNGFFTASTVSVLTALRGGNNTVSGNLVVSTNVVAQNAGASALWTLSSNSTTSLLSITPHDVSISPTSNTTVSGTSLKVNPAATLANTLAVTGAVTLSNTVAVTGAVTMANTLAVTGTASVNGATTLNSTLVVAHATALGGNASVAGLLSISQANVSAGALANVAVYFNTDPTSGIFSPGVGQTSLSSNGALVLTAGLSGLVVAAPAAFSNTLAVTGAATLSNALSVAGTLAVTKAVTMANTLAVTGAATLSNALSVVGSAALSNSLAISGATTANSVTATYVQSTGNLDVTGAVTMANTLLVTGISVYQNTFSVIGAVSLSNTIVVNGAVTLNKTLTVGANASVNGVFSALNSMNVTGAAALSNTLIVTGSVTLSNTAAVTGAATFSNNVVVNGANATFSTKTFATLAGPVYFSNVSSTGTPGGLAPVEFGGPVAFDNNILAITTGTHTLENAGLTLAASVNNAALSVSGYNGGVTFDANSSVVMDGSLQVGGNLLVNSSALFSNTMSISGRLDMGDDLTFSSGQARLNAKTVSHAPWGANSIDSFPLANVQSVDYFVQATDLTSTPVLWQTMKFLVTCVSGGSPTISVYGQCNGSFGGVVSSMAVNNPFPFANVVVTPTLVTANAVIRVVKTTIQP